MAYDEQGKQEHVQRRKTFEASLQQTGLILEREVNQRIHFVKIHVPREVLCQYAEILKLRMPIKDVSSGRVKGCSAAIFYSLFQNNEQLPKENIVTNIVQTCLEKCRVTLDSRKFPPQKYQLTAEFNKDKPYL